MPAGLDTRVRRRAPAIPAPPQIPVSAYACPNFTLTHAMQSPFAFYLVCASDLACLWRKMPTAKLVQCAETLTALPGLPLRDAMSEYDQHEHASLPRAAIWDVDGTLIDSGPLHFDAWSVTLLDEQFALTHDHFHATFGQRNDAVLRAFLGVDLADTDIVRIGTAKELLYRDMVRPRGLELLPGVRRWLIALQAAGWQQAIASSAPHANLEVIVEALGLSSFFGAIVAGDDVQHGKPDPAIFLLAAARLGVEPQRCVVVEDAP